MVSVIIPSYNHAPYLIQRIDSILNQTYQDFELILLDDYSQDESSKILEGYKNHPKTAHVVLNSQNSGSTFKQWKKGLDYAKGEWIWIAESDDFCELNFLNVLVNSGDQTYGLKYAASVPVDKAGDVVHDLQYPTLPRDSYTGFDFLSSYLLKGNYLLNASSVLIKRSLLEQILTPDVFSHKLFGDWLVWIKACLMTNVFFSLESKNYHRCHENTVRSNSQSNGLHRIELKTFRNAVKKIIRQSQISKKNELIRMNRFCYAHYLGMEGCGLIQKGQLIKAFPLILQSTYKLNFNFYYVRSAFYWLFKANKYD